MIKSKIKHQAFPLIYKNECKACNRCIIACKQNALELSHDLNEGGYNYAQYKGEGCNGCGDCYYMCPEPLAIEIRIPKKKSKKKSEDNEDEKENLNG